MDTLFLDRFEEYADEVVRTPHKRKSKPTDRKIKEKEATNTPNERITKHIDRLKLQWSNVPEEKQKENLEKYYKWVEISLKDKQPLFEESDLDIVVNKKITKVTHKPTGFFALSIGLESDHLRQRDAEINLYNKINKHYKDWTKASIVIPHS